LLFYLSLFRSLWLPHLFASPSFAFLSALDLFFIFSPVNYEVCLALFSFLRFLTRLSGDPCSLFLSAFFWPFSSSTSEFDTLPPRSPSPPQSPRFGLFLFSSRNQSLFPTIRRLPASVCCFGFFADGRSHLTQRKSWRPVGWLGAFFSPTDTRLFVLPFLRG